MIFITGFGLCKQPPVHIEMIRAVKTVLKAEELILAAVSMALKTMAGAWGSDDRRGCGIIFGVDNAIDECKSQFFKGLLQDGPLGASPLLFPYTSPNAITAQVTIAFGIKGEDITITSGPSSFLKAIDYGCEMLNRGVIVSAIVGGVSENEAVVMVMERLTPDETRRKKEAGITLKEVTGSLLTTCRDRYKNPLPQDVVKIKSIEDSFRLVADFIKGESKLITAGWILQIK